MTLATGYVLPGSFEGFIPKLQEDLIVEVGRSPEEFPVNRYVDWRIVDAPKGYYRIQQNNTQGMIINNTNNIWAPGAERPKILDGTAPFKYGQYQCIRRNEPYTLEDVGIETTQNLDLVAQAARMTSQKLMTGRTLRIHTTLTTSANWGSTNYSTSTSLVGGAWAAATSTNPYIRQSIIAVQLVINKATYGSLKPDELFMVMNPNTSKVMALAGEYIDFIKQQPVSYQMWEGQNQFRLYGLPDTAMGVSIIVDDTSYNSGPPGDLVSSNSFTLPDNYVVFLSKKKAVGSGPKFSTFSPFVYNDLKLETFNDVKNRLTEVHVSEFLDDSSNALVAPFSGFLLSIA